MVRTLVSMFVGIALALTAAAAQAQSLVGTWSTTISWDTPGGLMITSSFTADGRLQSTTQNRQGQAFMLSGVYQFQNGVLQYKWLDYAPKQICLAYCQPIGTPAPLGVVNSENIQFLNPNQFVSTTPNGSATYVRTNAAGVPGQ